MWRRDFNNAEIFLVKASTSGIRTIEMQVSVYTGSILLTEIEMGSHDDQRLADR
jgi:hypothetical protein